MSNRIIAVAFLLVISLSMICCTTTGVLVDSRDGKTYKTVMIGGQNWMAENLSYKTEEGSHCFQCKKYGRLYEWDAAQNACPEGWHLPTKEEWQKFYSRLGHPEMLKAGYDWVGHNSNDIDYYGFTVLPAGRYDDGKLSGRGSYAQFWSADVNEGPYFIPGDNTKWSEVNIDCGAAISVRCVEGDLGYARKIVVQNSDKCTDYIPKNKKQKNVRDFELVDSRDGQRYKTIMVDGEEWMAENLNYETVASFCYYNNQENCEKYGRVYDWIAAAHSCPDGWHLPNDDEWKSLAAAITKDYNPDIEDRYEDGSEDLVFNIDDGVNHSPYDTSTYRKFSYAAPHYDAPEFWSATQSGSSLAFKRWRFNPSVYSGTPHAIDNRGAEFTELYPVRCVRGSGSLTMNDQIEKFYQLRVQKHDSTLKIKDERDGQFYKFVTTGSQTWLAENMNYKKKNSVCYDNDPSNCEKYGMLYDYDDAKTVCPTGWRLPNAVDWAILKNETASGKIVERDVGNLLAQKDDWKDFYGFSALRAGFFHGYRKKFEDLGKVAAFWLYNKNYPETSRIEPAFLIAGDWFPWGKLPVRCIREEENVTYNEFLKDPRDGKKYKTVKIGNHIWMAENLNYESPEEGSRCYNDKPSLCTKYGRLYFYDAAQNACPAGWHLPRREEYVILSDAASIIYSNVDSGSPLRATKGWGNKKSQNGTDDFGFSALPGGSFNKSRFTFHEWQASGVGENAYYWTADGFFDINAGNMNVWTGSTIKIFGGEGMFSIRCVQDY